MKVLHLNYSDVGGAGIAAERISRALNQAGVDSSVLVCRKVNSHSKSQSLPRVGNIAARARASLVFRALKGLGFNREETRSINLLPSNILSTVRQHNPDILHLHWVNSEMISIRQLGQLNIPVVWTLHDMWAFCGTEHYTTSRRYIDGYSKVSGDECQVTGDGRQKSEDRGQMTEDGGQKSDGESPDASSPRPKASFDIDRWVFRRKQRHWKNWHPHIVTCSNWLAECARESVLFKDLPVDVIPNCLDLNVFKPMDQTEARRRFNLPLDKKLILFGAYNPSDWRKGGDLLDLALRQLNLTDVELAVFGAANGPQIAGLRTHWLGSFSKESDLAELYNAANVMAVPSRQDNLPNTIAESISCGVPVVGFKIGGIPDMVVHCENGWLASPFDTKELAEGLLWVLSQQNRLSVASRRKAEALFTPSAVAGKYQRIYEQTMAGIARSACACTCAG